MADSEEKTMQEISDTLSIHAMAESEFMNGLKEISDPAIPFDKKLDTAVRLNSQVLPYLFKELSAQKPNADRSAVGARMCTVLKNVTDIIVKKKESEVSEEINPDSPKFQKAFEWFIETVRVSMEEAGVDSISINNTFNVMVNRLQGWEQMVSRSLKGVTSKAMSEVENPFIRDFMSRLKVDVPASDGAVAAQSQSPNMPSVN